MKKKIDIYYELLNEIKTLSSSLSLLQWDQETKLPQNGNQYRAEQISQISSLVHEKSTSKKYQDVVEELSEDDSLSEVDRRSIEVSKRELDKTINLPKEFVKEFSKTKSLAHQTWVESKRREDFSIFKPSLEKIIKLTKEYAGYIDSSKPIYDVLLDDYEEGVTTEEIKAIFDPLRDKLKYMVNSVRTDLDGVSDAFAGITYKDDVVEEFIIKMVKQIGFDFDSGTVGRVHHPFETTLGPKDVRINMSYHHKDLSSTITGAIHELGHGLYEQNIDEKYQHTALNYGVSLGVHESQSRLLENMIGRSDAFWSYFTPELEAHFNCDLDQTKILKQLNRVSPSLIRIEADEITYNLHIILRFEIELMMLEDEFDLDELPEVWDNKMEDLLGIRPDKLSNGVLQDVHWSLGAIGYFPTYSLGNIIAGQLWDVFTNAHEDWDKVVSKGDFSQYFNWFKDKIWSHGSFYKPELLVENVVNGKTDSQYLVDYLRGKYVNTG